ncbi:MAG: hypothetical protein LBD37_01545 [Treponema sp.]|jgi:hypothetical protein|nr:hypothetical protein [Treponema sp.]
MKYRFMLILFNLITGIFLSLFFLAPFFLLGLDFFKLFWRSSWPLAALFFLIILGMDGYFLYNRRFFSLLEREDWPAMALFLENKVLGQGRYSSRLVRLLANTYLVLADCESVLKLENRIAAAKPLLLERHGLIFGAARVLGKQYAGAARFFQARLAKTGAGGKNQEAPAGTAQWLLWYYGFSQLLDRRYQEAAEAFSAIARSSAVLVPAGLSAYFLAGTLARVLPRRRGDLNAASAEGRDRVLAALPALADWQKQIEKLQAEAHIAVLAKYLQDAAQWLYQ